jgi:hypothetical protein
MAPIRVNDLLSKIASVCDDMAHTKEEAADAYEEIASYCETAATALREEIGSES